MAKNIEMNYLDSGGYEVLYPKNVSDISLASPELQTMLSLSEGDSVDDAFDRINNLIQLNAYGKAIVDIIVQTTSGNPIEGIPITGLSANIDGTGNLTTNSQGKASGYVSEGQTTISTPKYVDLTAGSWSETFVAGHVYSHTFSLKTTSGVITYNSSTSNLQFSSNVSNIGITVVGGGGGGGGGHYSYKNEEIVATGGGGGGGYCKVNDNVSFSPNTVYNLIVGSGGSMGERNEGTSSSSSGKNGGSGGNSSFLNIVAQGGRGGDRGYVDAPKGGSGNGPGGQGYDSDWRNPQEATNGGNGSTLGYDSSGNKTIRFGGGGGGGDNRSGGASYGGRGGAINISSSGVSASPNTGGGGGGGGDNGGSGGSGLVRIIVSLKVS